MQSAGCVTAVYLHDRLSNGSLAKVDPGRRAEFDDAAKTARAEAAKSLAQWASPPTRIVVGSIKELFEFGVAAYMESIAPGGVPADPTLLRGLSPDVVDVLERHRKRAMLIPEDYVDHKREVEALQELRYQIITSRSDQAELDSRFEQEQSRLANFNQSNCGPRALEVECNRIETEVKRLRVERNRFPTAEDVEERVKCQLNSWARDAAIAGPKLILQAKDELDIHIRRRSIVHRFLKLCGKLEDNAEDEIKAKRDAAIAARNLALSYQQIGVDAFSNEALEHFKTEAYAELIRIRGATGSEKGVEEALGQAELSLRDAHVRLKAAVVRVGQLRESSEEARRESRQGVKSRCNSRVHECLFAERDLMPMPVTRIRQRDHEQDRGLRM